MSGKVTRTLAERFWEKVDKGDGSGCWTWTGNVWHVGYGTIWRDGRPVYAHRVAFELQKGVIPSAMCVCHTCDNKLCMRGDHLFLGTHLDNMADKNIKGRQAKGEQRAEKLTALDVAEIRRRCRSGERQSVLAAAFGVNQSHVSRITRGLGWKHV
jgi:hypothetical protein